MTHPDDPHHETTGEETGNRAVVPEPRSPGEVIRFPHQRPTPEHKPGEVPGHEQHHPAPAAVGERAGQAATAAPPDEVPDEPENAKEGKPVPVDPPEQGRPSLLTRVRAAERYPIVPGWARSRTQFRDAACWVAGYYTHASGYHLSRVPLYAARLAWRAPRGAAKVCGGVSRWMSDAEGIPVRLAAVHREDAELYLKLSRHRDARVRARTIAVFLAAPLLVVAAGLVLVSPPLAQSALAAVLVMLFGMWGSPADKPLVGRAVVEPKVAKLTSDGVVRALSVLGLAGINQALAKNPKAMGFPSPITRDGPGWRADVDLPPGVTVGEVADRRDKLASGLGRPLGCVWPEGNAEIHPGRLVLWVGDQDMSKTKPPVWPVARSGSVDLFRPFPFGTDQRGRPVSLTLMFASMVIGSIPRMGKTFAMRLVLLAAALDTRAELHTYDLKGTGDFSSLEPVAYRYRAGDDEDDIAYGLTDLRELQAELRRRTKVIRGLPRHLCPENKITPELAGVSAYRLHPIVIGVDECQRWFEHPTYGDELIAICEDLVRRGPAAGIIPLFGTQRPDAKSLPTGISSNAVLRFCLKVMGQLENDMVLGTSMYKNGVRATMFTRRDLGIGYLTGEGDEPQITRSFYLDAPAAERIVTRARAMREQAGTLSGHALGEAPQTASIASVNLLEDLLAVIPTDEVKVWNETAVARLAELRPEVYRGWEAEQLTVALKPHGITVGQVWGTDPETGKGANRRGITRTHLTDSITERNKKPDGS